MSDGTAPAGEHTDDSSRLGYIDHIRSAGRMMQAADLAGKLTPLEFKIWMECGEVLIQCMKENEKAPSAHAGKQEAQGA